MTELAVPNYRARRIRDVAGTFERRSYCARLEMREAGPDGGLHFSGYASVFHTPYQVEGYVERVAPGAFKRSLAEGADVVLNLEHGKGASGLPIARTKSGTLKLREESYGLKVDADLDA